MDAICGYATTLGPQIGSLAVSVPNPTVRILSTPKSLRQLENSELGNPKKIELLDRQDFLEGIWESG